MNDAEKLAHARQLSGVRVETIGFHVRPGQAQWMSGAVHVDERPAGSPLAPGETVTLEGESGGEEIWWVGRLNGQRTPNMSRYSRTRLHLSCSTGSAAALDALSEFLNASWLHDLDDPMFLTDLAEMTPGSGVNLREEGQAVRESDGQWVQLWAGESYFDGPAQASVQMDELSEITALCLHFWQLRQRFGESLKTMTYGSDLPIENELPRYEAGRGFVNTERWN